MAPTDESAALSQARLEYKAEVAELLTKQQEALTKLQEALTKHQEMVAKQQQSLHELDLYKWGIRAFLVLVLGGSIWTILKYKDVIDTQIAARMLKSDKLNLAIYLANSGQWRESLAQLDEIWPDIGRSSQHIDPEYRSFFFRNVLWVISQAEETLPDGSWVGEAEWKQLNQNGDFQREFVTTGRWDADEEINNHFAFCILKFDGSSQALRTASSYLQKSLDSAHPAMRKAPHLFALAMVDLIEQRTDDALKKLQEASELDPSNYELSDFNKYRKSFMNSTEFKIWQGVAKRVGSPDFERAYLNLCDRISSLNSPRPGKEASGRSKP